ncbi:hypothetical protein M3Y99_01011500 [Aphelenchoides fujianensis]|nr:hypothetical protein M3Y99_01011500 [Aphelenchoides fujianensis]
MSGNSNSPQDEAEAAESSAIIPQRAAPPPPAPRLNIPPPPQDELPPPYDAVSFPSLHAQSSRLLAGWEPSQKPPEERFVSATNNRNPEAANGGFRTCTRHLTLWNLLIAFAVLFALIGSTALLSYFLSGKGENDVLPNTTTIPSILPTTSLSTLASTTRPLNSKRATIPLQLKQRILGAFQVKYQSMQFDSKSNAIILSKYSPAEKRLASAKMVVSNYRQGFTYYSHRIPASYARCSRLSEEFMCCATSPRTDKLKTDCFFVPELRDEIKGAYNTSAPFYDYKKMVHSRDDFTWLIVFNRQQHALYRLWSETLYPIEDNRLSRSYVFVGFSFPVNDKQKLEELVRAKEDFQICEYKRQFHPDAYQLLKPCQTAPFNVDHELPNVNFCSNAIFTAVVQYGYRGRGDDLSFLVELVFNGENKVYSSQEFVRTPYEQLAMDCNAEKKTLDIYVMGETEIVAFGLEISDIRPE